MYLAKKLVWESSSDIQICAGQESGSETANHTMRDFYEQDKTEAATLVALANAFNNINEKVLLQNIKILCFFESTYVLTCYGIPACLFIVRGNYCHKKKQLKVVYLQWQCSEYQVHP